MMREPTVDMMDVDVRPFEAALQEVHSRLMNAHYAALSTYEAELQRMRRENTLLRMKLTEVAPDSCSASFLAAAPAPAPAAAATRADSAACDRVKETSPSPAQCGISSSATAQTRAATQEPAVMSTPTSFAPAETTQTQAPEPAPSAASPRSRLADPVASHSAAPTGVGEPAVPTRSTPPASTASWPKEGCVARLCNLRGAPELNGSEGICLGLDVNKGRWIIRLPSGEERSVRQENLEPVNFYQQDSRPAPVASAHSTRDASARADAESALTEEPEEVIEEVSTSGAKAAAAGGATSADGNFAGRGPENEHQRWTAAAASTSKEPEAEALYEALARLGLTDIEVLSGGGGVWSIAGMQVLLGRGGNAPGTYGGLLASIDGGKSWEVFEDVYRRTAKQSASASSASSASNKSRTAQPGPQQRPPTSSQQPRSAPQPEPWQKVPWPPQGQSSAGYRVPTAGGAAVSGGERPHAGLPPTAGGVDGQLPTMQSNGLPTFNNSFPSSFSANSGSSQYYSQFRVRVPSSSQYDSF